MKRYTVEVTWAEVTHHRVEVVVTTDREIDAHAIAMARTRNAAPGRRNFNPTTVAVERVADDADVIVTMTPMPEKPLPGPGRRDHHHTGDTTP